MFRPGPDMARTWRGPDSAGRSPLQLGVNLRVVPPSLVQALGRLPPATRMRSRSRASAASLSLRVGLEPGVPEPVTVSGPGLRADSDQRLPGRAGLPPAAVTARGAGAGRGGSSGCPGLTRLPDHGYF
jgi:hypothetical protein